MTATYQLRVCMDNLLDALPCERLLTEPPLDIIQHLRVRGVCLVEDVAELQVRGAQTVTEVLREDPAAVFQSINRISFYEQRGGGRGRTGISSFLYGVPGLVAIVEQEEGVVGETVEKGRLFPDLEDGVLDGGRLGVGQRVEVERDDCDPVRELL